MSAGKGDKQRPMRVTAKEFEENWNRIFKKREKKGLKFHKVYK